MTLKPRRNLISDLASKVTKSDDVAFNRLFNLLWEELFVFSKSILMDETVAKDILQEVWINYWERRTQIKNTNIRAYLYQAVRYKTYNHLRDNKLNTLQLNTIKELGILSKMEEQENFNNTLSVIEQSMKNLPLRCKEIFILSKLEGVANEEIAQHFDISKRTVENQISIALKKVKKNLEISN